MPAVSIAVASSSHSVIDSASSPKPYEYTTVSAPKLAISDGALTGSPTFQPIMESEVISLSAVAIDHGTVWSDVVFGKVSHL